MPAPRRVSSREPGYVDHLDQQAQKKVVNQGIGIEVYYRSADLLTLQVRKTLVHFAATSNFFLSISVKAELRHTACPRGRDMLARKCQLRVTPNDLVCCAPCLQASAYRAQRNEEQQYVMLLRYARYFLGFKCVRLLPSTPPSKFNSIHASQFHVCTVPSILQFSDGDDKGPQRFQRWGPALRQAESSKFCL